MMNYTQYKGRIFDKRNNGDRYNDENMRWDVLAKTWTNTNDASNLCSSCLSSFPSFPSSPFSPSFPFSLSFPSSPSCQPLPSCQHSRLQAPHQPYA